MIDVAKMVMVRERYKPMHFYPKQEKIALRDTAKEKKV